MPSTSYFDCFDRDSPDGAGGAAEGGGAAVTKEKLGTSCLVLAAVPNTVLLEVAPNIL